MIFLAGEARKPISLMVGGRSKENSISSTRCTGKSENVTIVSYEASAIVTFTGDVKYFCFCIPEINKYIYISDKIF